MPYEMPPYRPPSEASSLLLRVTRGCPWNKCAFCDMYKDLKFEIRPVDDVKRDIDTALAIYGSSTKRVFLGDSNTILMKTDKLIEILKYLNKRFPQLERVTSYGRAVTLAKTRSLEELKKLLEAGLKRLHVGLETGDNELLKYITKGATAEEMVSAGLKASEAGFELTFYVILGLGGKDRSVMHAVNTAKVLNKVNPTHIRFRTLMLRENTPLQALAKTGEFKPASPLEILKETKMIIENLNVESIILSDHASNYTQISGKLPREKDNILEYLNILITTIEASPELSNRILTPEGLRHL